MLRLPVLSFFTSDEMRGRTGRVLYRGFAWAEKLSYPSMPEALGGQAFDPILVRKQIASKYDVLLSDILTNGFLLPSELRTEVLEDISITNSLGPLICTLRNQVLKHIVTCSWGLAHVSGYQDFAVKSIRDKLSQGTIISHTDFRQLALG